MRRRLPLLPWVLTLFPALLTAAPPPASPPPSSIDPKLLAGMKARSIGPAVMSGRVADVQAVESNPNIIYVGSAAGGVWKSINAGLSWDPIFEDQGIASIGAIAIDQANPDVVWVGTGEGNPRNSMSFGNGVYRTLDGGKTWQHLGLEKTERIYRIVLHPSNPDVAWVSALGQAWGENPDRGVFKTTDGGKSWRKVLYVDEKTGASDLLIDPRNPNKLFASMWQYRRWPWIFKSGGPGSGLYVTYDGGESWKKYTESDGLPKGDLGRIGLALCRSNPDVVYALVEAEKSALLRSADGGKSWTVANDDQRTAERPFYYSDIRVDPQYPNRVYNLTANLQVSDDSGKTFDRLGRSREIHGDYHALWIDPKDPAHLIVGEDGGVGFSRDRGESWQFIFNLPFGQYYHIAADNDLPYHVYGGLQDNGSWRGPSAVWNDGDIRNERWERVGGGDGFDTRPDPQDSEAGYSMSQGGELVRWNLRRREQKTIKPPEPKAGEGREKLRFNWNAGLAQDPFDPATLYLGSQYVHKSTDRGDSWTIISPDLTTDNAEWQRQFESGGITLDVTAAENFTTILSLVPSPLERGVLWVGTDDGRLHVTRDGGAHWTSVEKNVKGVPANTWIPHITLGKTTPGQAFAVFDNHRRGDFTPYVYRTDDYGATWKSLATSDLKGWAWSIEQDPVDKDLLFLGTELGLWVSFDGGAHWLAWHHGVPTTPVADLLIHPRDQDLIIATHGRALFILDDIQPLRSVTPATLAEPVHLYPQAKALLYRRPGGGGGGGGRAGSWEFRGENRPFGAILTYSLNAPGLAKPGDKPAPAADPRADSGGSSKGDAKNPKAEIRITDAQGNLIRNLKQAPSVLGLNRVVWDLSREPFDAPPTDNRGRQRGGDRSGPIVPPGTYNVSVKLGDQESKGTVQVEAEPDLQVSAADWQEWDAAVKRMGALQNAVVAGINRIGEARSDIDDVLRKLEPKGGDRDKKPDAADPNKALRDAAKELQKKLTEAERKLYVPPTTKGIVEDETAMTESENAARAVGSAWGKPTPTFRLYMEEAETKVRDTLAGLNKLFAEDVAAFRQKVDEAKIGLLAPAPPLEVKP